MLPVQRSLHWAWALQYRERRRLQSEMSQIRGLMPLLMKQRNGYRWTETDRRKIRAQFRKLAELSPYMVLFVSPGGFFVIPILAWWLDRRRQRRASEERQASAD
jgi:hypothetical protein